MDRPVRTNLLKEEPDIHLHIFSGIHAACIPSKDNNNTHNEEFSV